MMWKLILARLFFSALFVVVSLETSLAANVCFQCHEQHRFQGNVVHKPVAEGKCSVCHNPHVARYKKLLRRKEGELCYSCHKKQAVIFTKGIVHGPVRQGNCTACHDSHASALKGLVRKDLSRACLQCHKDLKVKYKFTHEPYGNGQCTSCHRPHNSDRAQLLNADPEALCATCHDRRDLRQGHRNYPGPIKGCLTCHNPHGSDRPALVRNILHKPYKEGCSTCHQQGQEGVAMAVCLKCHQDVEKQILATHSHLGRHRGNSCLNCHSPHAGDEKSLLKGREKQVCKSCHQSAMETFRESAYKHNNIDQCSDCHEPHGSRKLALLKGDGTEVCVRCHKTQGAFTHPIGPNILDIRTGHPMSCVTCHNPMGTEYKFSLVEDGKKKLCIHCHLDY